MQPHGADDKLNNPAHRWRRFEKKLGEHDHVKKIGGTLRFGRRRLGRFRLLVGL